MTPLSWIRGHGIQVSLVGPESILLDGLDRLDIEESEKVVAFARQNKLRLLAELRTHVRGKCDPLVGAMCKHCVHHSVTCVCSGPCTARGMTRDPDAVACHVFVAKSARQSRRPALVSAQDKPEISTRRAEVRRRLSGWRVARLWLQQHLPSLMTAGFTRRELFGVGVLRYPYKWGAAWSSKWTDPDWRASVNDDGFIEWRTTNPTRREVTQTTKPMVAMTKGVAQ